MTVVGSIVRRGGAWLPLLGAAAVFGSLCSLALPTVLGRTVDAIVSEVDSSGWLAAAAGLVVLRVLVDLTNAFAGTACFASTSAWLRSRLLRHVLAVSAEDRGRFDSGDLVSRLSGNAPEAAGVGPAVVSVAATVVTPAGSLVLLVLVDVWLAVAFLAGVAVVAVVLRSFTVRTAEVVAGYLRTQGRIAGRLAESLAGIRTIAAAGTVEREERRILEALPELHEQGRRSWRVLSRSMAHGSVVGPLVLVAVLATGGLELARGRITAGELFAASQYAVLGSGLGGVTSALGRLARARAGVSRVSEVLELEPVRHGRRELPDGPGEVEFRGVSVRAGDTTLLADVSLIVPGGAAVAVVGHSGAGKSVLAALAVRLREPDEGQVLLDGVPLPELSHDALRAAVGCAVERPVLVGATLADAIGPGRPGHQVRAAARATYAHDFIQRLPDGYDTPPAEAPMSGGERQRLGLARSWPASRLLVLDDATSSLDMVTEMRISETLVGAGRERRTRLIITHRRATAARSDLVVWLADGRVRAVGQHERLWAEPAYRAVFG